MIDKKELRIGNFVLHQLGGKLIPYEIAIRDFKVDTFEYMHGITLTEEWLLKFGGKKEGGLLPEITNINIDFDGGEIRYNKSYNRISLELHLPDWYDYGAGYLDLNKIKFVHQLQNLYWGLCVKELELK